MDTLIKEFTTETGIPVVLEAAETWEDAEKLYSFVEWCAEQDAAFPAIKHVLMPLLWAHPEDSGYWMFFRSPRSHQFGKLASERERNNTLPKLLSSNDMLTTEHNALIRCQLGIRMIEVESSELALRYLYGAVGLAEKAPLVRLMALRYLAREQFDFDEKELVFAQAFEAVDEAKRMAGLRTAELRCARLYEQALHLERAAFFASYGDLLAATEDFHQARRLLVAGELLHGRPLAKFICATVEYGNTQNLRTWLELLQQAESLDRSCGPLYQAFNAATQAVCLRALGSDAPQSGTFATAEAFWEHALALEADLPKREPLIARSFERIVG